MNSRWLVLVSLLAISLLISGCTSPGSNLFTGEKVGFTLKVLDGQDKVLLEKHGFVSKGVNGLQAMQELVQVEYTESTYGAFVKSINGISPAYDEYLALYVDGEYADKGIDSYIIDKEMTVEWRKEKITSFSLE